MWQVWRNSQEELHRTSGTLHTVGYIHPVAFYSRHIAQPRLLGILLSCIYPSQNQMIYLEKSVSKREDERRALTWRVQRKKRVQLSGSLFFRIPISTMLPVNKVSSRASALAQGQVFKRNFFLTAATTLLGSFVFNENNRLADKMESGKLHYKDVNALISQQRASENDFSSVKPVDRHPQYFKRSKAQYAGHVPLFNFERLLMFVGLSVGSYFHPERNEFIVGLGESTAFPFVLRRLQEQMLSDSVGRSILRERPRITSTLLDLDYLRLLPDNTIGKTYIKWLDREGVSPDTRVPVKYIDDEELAYIFQRYRECHDFYHAITGLPIIIEGEIAVKVLEYMNIGIPMSGLGALFAPLRLKPKQKNRLYNIYYPWAMKSGLNSKPLINVYWENILEKDINEFRREMGIEQPPDLRELRKSQKNKK